MIARGLGTSLGAKGARYALLKMVEPRGVSRHSADVSGRMKDTASEVWQKFCWNRCHWDHVPRLIWKEAVCYGYDTRSREVDGGQLPTADDGWSFCTKAEVGRASRSERPYVTDVTRVASMTARLTVVSYDCR